MAKDVLVTEALSEQMTAAGAKLIERLDADTAQVNSAFWLFFSEDRLWKLIISSPLVITGGPKSFYKRVASANRLAAEDECVISLNDIGVTGPEHQVVKLLGIAIHSAGIGGIRFSRSTVNGHFIEDAYIYRSTSVASVSNPTPQTTTASEQS